MIGNPVWKAVTFDEPDVVFRATKIAFTPDTPPIKANDSFALRKDFVRQTLDLLETQLRTEQESIKERKKKERQQSKRVRKSLPPKANQTNQGNNHATFTLELEIDRNTLF